MKRYCKQIDITNLNLIEYAIISCLKGKYFRHDTIELFYKNDPFKRNFNTIQDCLVYKDKDTISFIIENIAKNIQKELINKNLQFTLPKHDIRYDTSCHKWRDISIYTIKQQIYNYIAVLGLNDIFKRIGEYQCASIPNRGQAYGVKAIKHWIQNKQIIYVWKGDIKKCFPSIKREFIMNFLNKYVANSNLLWLINELLKTNDGLSIGSYLSQWLCNLYLSQLYHYISEECYFIQNNKRVSLVSHVLFYMDDILILGKNKKHLLILTKLIHLKLKTMGLCLKDNWRLWKITSINFIDIMGIKIYLKYTTIRSRVFLRIRRTLKKAKQILDKHQKLSLKLAHKFIAYWGLLKNTNSFRIIKKYNAERTLLFAKEIISYASRNICYST